MALAKSRITAQGQISIPAEVRRRLGVRPGSTLEWTERDGNIVVKRSGRFTFDDIHKVLFEGGPAKKLSVKQMDEAVAQYMRERHARR